MIDIQAFKYVEQFPAVVIDVQTSLQLFLDVKALLKMIPIGGDTFLDALPVYLNACRLVVKHKLHYTVLSYFTKPLNSLAMPLLDPQHFLVGLMVFVEPKH